MPDISQEELDKLHAAGHISPELHANLKARNDLTSSGMDAYKGGFNAVQEHPLTQKVDAKLKEIQENPTMKKADAAVTSGIDKVRDVIGGGVKRVSDAVVDTVLTQDQKIAMNKRKIEKMQSEVEANKAALQPREGGEIDEPAPEPGVRQPVMQERAFSNPADKEEYLKQKLKEKR